MMSLPSTKRPQNLKAPETEFDRFVYTVSHDLQEPLRLISSFVKLVNVKFGDQVPDECQEYLNYITEHSDRMKSM
ncbi:MAG: hypothetical protein HKN32_07720, partial [Flavobacteriales bacterium]|nr:hypothetical protein [Flavobacteriales bacterium]